MIIFLNLLWEGFLLTTLLGLLCSEAGLLARIVARGFYLNTDREQLTRADEWKRIVATGMILALTIAILRFGSFADLFALVATFLAQVPA